MLSLSSHRASPIRLGSIGPDPSRATSVVRALALLCLIVGFATQTSSRCDAQTVPPHLTPSSPTIVTVGSRTIIIEPLLLHGAPIDGARHVTILGEIGEWSRTLGKVPDASIAPPRDDLPRAAWERVEAILGDLGHAPHSFRAAPGWPDARWIEKNGSFDHALIHAVHLFETNEQLELWIDSSSGALLDTRSLVRRGGEFPGTVVGRIPADQLPYSATVPTTLVPLADLRVLPAGMAPVFTDGQGEFTAIAMGNSLLASAELTGAYVEVQNQAGPDSQEFAPLSLGVPTTIEFGNPSDEFMTAEVAAYAIPSAARRWLLEVSPDLTAADVPVLVHVNIAGTCYAAYLPIFQVIQLTRAGGGCANAAYGTLVAHEYFHHIQNQLPGAGELEVEEANADIFAAYFLEDPRIGAHYFGPDASIRDLSLPVTYPVASSSPQESGLPLAAAFWDLRTELMASLGPAAGQTAAVELWLTWVLAGSGQLDPGTLEEILLLDDDDGNLANGTPHGDALIATFPPHGLTLPLEPVSGFTCEAVEERVELSWTLPTLGTQTSIEVHRDGVVLASLSPNAMSYVDPLPPAGFHEWFVVTRQGPGTAVSAACPQTLTTVLPFVRGDVSGNAILDLGDAISLLTYMFAGAPLLTCLDAGDVNDDGINDLSDGLHLLGFLFGQGDPPAAPFPESDYDPTPDGLLCN